MRRSCWSAWESCSSSGASAFPRALVAPVTAIAGASLGIYLTHFALLTLLDVGVPPVVLVVLGLRRRDRGLAAR